MNESLDERYALTWPCGGADHWAVMSDGNDAIIEYRGDLRELQSKTYNPLSRPELCENLGALGAAALSRGAAAYSAMSTNPNAATAGIRVASNDPEVQAQALAFVKTYGPPHRDFDAAFLKAPRGRESVLSIFLLLMNALDLNDALRIAHKARRTERDREALLEHLSHALYFGLRHKPRFVKAGLVIEHAADSLISAAWLQLAEALAPGGKGFRVCKDPACGQLFGVRHKNEKYHTDRCRNRHAVELHRARQRKGTE